MDQNKVIKRIKSGNEEEVAMVYKKYRSEFFHWSNRHFGCSLEDAKEIYQMTILTFYENILSGKLTVLTSTVKTYLFAIGKNKIFDFQKTANKVQFISEQIQNEEMNFMEELLDKDEDVLELVEKCLERLGDPCKTILYKFYYKRLSLAELTESLGYKNYDTSKNIKYKCLQRLRGIYNEEKEKL